MLIVLFKNIYFKIFNTFLGPFCDPTTMPVGEQNRLPEMVLQAVTCAVCFFKKKYQLKLKNCGHRFCITCTYKLKKQDESVKCPMCRSVSKGEEIVADVQTTDLFLYFQPQLEAVREDGEDMEGYELPLEYQYPDGVDFLEEPSESDMEEMDSTYEDEEMDESIQFMDESPNIFEQSMDFINETLELPDTSADIFDEASNLPSHSNDSLQTTNNWEDAHNLLEDIENYFRVHGM